MTTYHGDRKMSKDVPMLPLGVPVVEVRAPYGYDADAVSVTTGLYCDDPSLTVQSDADDADINTLVRRFGLTGELPQNLRAPLNADFVPTVSYHEALNQLILADMAFMEMPANVRARFDNNAAKFVEFCSDGANALEMQKLGLLGPSDPPVVVDPGPRPVHVNPDGSKEPS